MHGAGRRRPLNIWGWGYADEALDDTEIRQIHQLAAGLAGGALTPCATPRIEDFALPAPSLRPPDTLAPLLSDSPYDRLSHAYGKSFADMARMLLRDLPHPPDLVAFPRTEQQVVDLLDWAASASAAVVPYGGGTSVCGGVECDVGDGYRGVVSLDMQYLDRVLDIDRVSRAARIQAGANGEELEAQLRPHGLTLRHFPQSFQFSTLGGWIATRAGGHYASLYTHIDDFVEATRLVTGAGILQTRRLPGSGAGPSPDRLVLGSEGILGVITEAWLRLQDRPRHRASRAVRFTGFAAGVEAVRALSQSGLYPSNCRLLDPLEASMNGLGDGREAWLVLGFESADHPVDAWLARALELVADHGGQAQEPGGGSDVSGHWRQAFLRMPYYRNETTRLGIIADTFETAVTWDRFAELYDGVREQLGGAIERETGAPAVLSCRFTHIYPDGPAPYFTFYALGSRNGDLRAMLDRWRVIKREANDAVVRCGGTVTHHHAVGRDHRGGYEAQSSPLFRDALRSVKARLDPAGILNPGVLVDPPRGPWQGGVLAD